MKSLRVDHCEVPILIKDGIKHTTNWAKVNVLTYHFSSVFTHYEEATLLHMGPRPYLSLPDMDINITGVTNLLRPDCIPAKVLNDMAKELSPKYILPPYNKEGYHRIGRGP